MAFNPGLGSGERIFSYIVSGMEAVDGQVLSFPFTDTAGNRIKCNFFELTIHYSPEGNDNGQTLGYATFHVEPSSTLHTQTINSVVSNPNLAVEYSISDASSGNVSGVCGYAGFADMNTPGHMMFKSDNKSVIDGLNIVIIDHPHNGEDDPSIDLEITYGSVLHYNTLRTPLTDPGV